MQTNKSHADSARFDLFECLTCHTTIRELKPVTDDKKRR